MRLSNKKIVLVDAYSLGALFSRVLAGTGYDCIHVRSGAGLPKKLMNSFPAECFSEDLSVESIGLNEINDYLTNFDIEYVIPCSEPGVELADTLAAKLNISRNDSALSTARRDKYLMHEALKARNVRSISHFISNDLSEIRDWVKQSGLTRYVLKPLSGGGGHNVFICSDSTSMEIAFNTILNNTNLFNQANDKVLAQEYLVGDEYIVNSVSLDANEFFTDMWHISKVSIDGHPVCSYADSIDTNDDIWILLTNYVRKVLPALGIAFGPAHCEIMLTVRGPVLIECGARFEGAVDMPAIASCFQTNQILAVTDAIYSPHYFINRIKDPRPRRCKYMRHIYLICNKSGVLSKPIDFKAITELNGLYSLQHGLVTGSQIERTTDLFKSPGFAYIEANSNAELEAIYMEFRRLENLAYDDAIQ